MIDITGAIRTAVAQKLRNQITLDGKTISVRARVPSTSDTGNYIYIPMQSTSNASAKDFDSVDHTMDIEVVYRSEDGTNINPLETMTNRVMQILAVKNQIDMPQVAGAKVVDFVFVRRNELIDYDGTYTILRAILTFEAIIDEQ